MFTSKLRNAVLPVLVVLVMGFSALAGDSTPSPSDQECHNACLKLQHRDSAVKPRVEAEARRKAERKAAALCAEAGNCRMKCGACARVAGAK